MKKLATFVLLLCVGMFTVAPLVGCGGKDDKGGKDKKTEKKEEKK